MKKLLIKIGVLSVVLLGLLTLNMWKSKQAEKKTAKEDQEKKLFTETSIDAFDRIVVETTKGRVVFAKRKSDGKGTYLDEFAPLDAEAMIPNAWIVVEPFKDVLDRAAFTGLIDLIKEIASKKTVAENANDIAEYGLTNPKIKIELYKAGQAAPAWMISVGDENTAGDSFYAMTSVSSKVYLIDKTIDFNASKEPKEWRTKSILTFKDVNQVQALKVGAYELVREGDAWFVLQGAKKWPASQMTAEAMIRDINTLTMKSLVSENLKADGAKYGLTKPELTVTLKIKSAAAETEKSILVGKTDKKAGSVYVARGDSTRIYEVNPTFKESVSKTFAQVVSKDAFYIKEALAESISVEFEGHKVKLVKQDSKWVQEKDKANKAAKALGDAYEIFNLDALDYLGEKFAGLTKDSKPTMTITIASKTENEELLIYPDPKSAEHKIGFVKKYGLYYRFFEKDLKNIQDSIKEVLGLKVEKPESQEPIAGETLEGHEGHGH